MKLFYRIKYLYQNIIKTLAIICTSNDLQILQVSHSHACCFSYGGAFESLVTHLNFTNDAVKLFCNQAHALVTARSFTDQIQLAIYMCLLKIRSSIPALIGEKARHH